MRKFSYMCFLLCMTLLLMSVAAFSVGAVTSGTAGNIQWSLDGTVLTISGSGKLSTPYGNGPWGNSITQVEIGEGITSIEAGVFADCKTLSKISLPSTLKVIGNGAFSNCIALTAIEIPQGVTTIDTYAFANCSDLVNIQLPKNVIDLGIAVFSECYSLASIQVDADNPAYTSVDGVLFSKDMSVLVRYPADKMGRTYSVPSSVEEISIEAFESAWNLYDIQLHDGIKKIGLNAFYKTQPFNDSSKFVNGCFYLGNHLIALKNENMVTCTIREGTKTIADGAFVAAKHLKEIVLPEGLESIGDSAFSWCEALQSVSVPKSVKRIDDSAFYDCKAIKNVFYTGTREDRNHISIGGLNTTFTGASWKYSACHGGNEHTWGNSIVIKDVTCTVAGERQVTCSVCSMSQIEQIEPTGHNHVYWSQVTAPTCVEIGKEESCCTVCGAIETRTKNALGHVFGPWSIEIPPLCEDVGVKKQACAVCQFVQVSNVDPKGHHVETWTVSTDSTCTVDGEEVGTCVDCNAIQKRNVPAHGHSYTNSEIVQQPTFYKTGLEKRICEVCGDEQSNVLEKTNIMDFSCRSVVSGSVVWIVIAAGCVMMKKKKLSCTEK